MNETELNNNLSGTIFDKLPIGVYIVQRGKFKYVNQRFAEVVGLPVDALIGIDSLSFVQTENIEPLKKKWVESLKNGNATPLKYPVKTSSGETRWFLEEVTSINYQGSRATLGNVMDITSLHRAEDEVIKLNKELTEANRELESFAYSVSHDLRAPLRSIDGFSSALVEDYGDKLDSKGKDFLQRVRKAAQRMAVLIDDILMLSRVTRYEMTKENIDLSGIANEIVRELRATKPERNVEFIIADDLAAIGDSHMVRIALNNLLDNAWKFTGKHASARIEFGVIRVEGKPMFFVKDDGAGFEMNYANKLFSPFQRLHSNEEFPGTGIGLAIVQRIIRRHGGNISAESQVEKGTTFYFTIG
jgi:PAS domain S-box-containing protein